MADPVREVVVRMSEWVPLSVASERLGCSVVTLKRRIKRGELPTQREARPQGYRLLVEIPDDAPEKQSSETTVLPDPETIAALTETIRILNGQLEAARLREEWYQRELTVARALPAPDQRTGAETVTTIAETASPPDQDTSSHEGTRLERPWWQFWS